MTKAKKPTEMKTDELELKFDHLTGHLPYRLKGMWIDICNKERLHELVGLDIESERVGLIAYGKNINWYSINQFKPIFHPLSDLIKPIIHNGEKFVPHQYIYTNDFYSNEKGEKPNYTDCLLYKHSHVRLHPNNWMYERTIKLFEWHFDIHGLIKAGLAIDVNKLSENPYK